MKRMLRWTLDNALVSLGMIAAAAIVAGMHQAGEVDATAYRVLAESWPRAHEPLRAHIRKAIAGGTISKWEYTDLFREAVDDLHGLAITTGGDVEVERRNLLHVIERGEANNE